MSKQMQIKSAQIVRRRWNRRRTSTWQPQSNGGNVLSSTTRIFPENILTSSCDPLPSVSETINTFKSTDIRRPPNLLKTTETHHFYAATPDSRISHKQRFFHDHRGNLTKIISRYGTSIADTTRYERNRFGLVTRVIRSAPEIPPIEQIFGYDLNYRFRTSQTTVGLGTSTQTFNIWGQVLSRTAIGGQTTRYQYDAFGRLKRIRSPEGITTTRTIRREENEPGAVHTLLVRQSGRPDVKFFLDTLDRTIKTKSQNPSGTIITRTEFNNRGQVVRTSMPHFANETPRWTTFEYDIFGRLKTRTFENLTTRYSYRQGRLGFQNVLIASITDPNNRTTKKYYNLAGDLILSRDAMGGEIRYYYFAPRFVNRIVAPGNAVTIISYDEFGRQISLTDPNAGTVEFEYDAFDRIIRQTDAKGNITKNEFDEFGRSSQTIKIDAITGEHRITTYTYIAGSNNPNVGRLHSITVNNGTAQIFQYDNFGRTILFKDVFENNTLITEYTYDQFGNLQTYTFPSGFRLHYTHDANGFKTHIRENNSTGRVIWQLGSVNALGQELTSTAVGRSRTNTFNEFGQPLTMSVHGLMNYTYTYDRHTGNMLSRQNPLIGQSETFTYDALNRLTTGVVFSSCGNITWKDGVGDFFYRTHRPHAVDSICGVLGLREHLNHRVYYTSFQKISEIIAEDIPIFLSANFVYGANRQRRQMNVLFGDNILTKHYTQNFEVSRITDINGNEIFTETKEYIFSPFGLIAIRNNGQLNAVATDHLGSIVARFNPRVGDYEFFGYTAWGRRYRYEDGQKFFFDESSLNFDNPTDILNYFARGFTGHEHMDAFGLINMNGRLYDPIIGRFLSPDPFVQAPWFTQSFNRYSYVLNNPLRFVDPTGFLWSDVGYGYRTNCTSTIGKFFDAFRGGGTIAQMHAYIHEHMATWGHGGGSSGGWSHSTGSFGGGGAPTNRGGAITGIQITATRQTQWILPPVWQNNRNWGNAGNLGGAGGSSGGSGGHGSNTCPTRITWQEGMPTIINVGINRFVVPYAGGNFINLTDRSLRTAFNNSFTTNQERIMRRTLLLDIRVLDLWVEAAAYMHTPPTSLPNSQAASERVRNRHLDRLESTYRRRNIIK